MRIRLAPLAVACALMVAGTAQAVTLDFNNLATNGSADLYVSISSNGFDITTDTAFFTALGVWNKDASFQADPGMAAVFVNGSGSITTIKRTDNASFGLYSIDLADTYNYGSAYSYDFTFFTSGGSTEQTVTIDTSPGLQTFVLNKTQLTSFSFGPSTGVQFGPQFDNVVLSTAAPVPEASTSALLALGLGVLAFVHRRKGH